MKNLILLTVLIIGALSSPAFAAGVKADLFKIAKPGSAADKVIKLGDVRQIRSNETSGKLEFSNDGVAFKGLDEGDGSLPGNAINGVNDLVNSDFEAGFDSDWTSSAGDSSQLTKTGCTLGTDCSLVGEISLRFSPSAQNDFFESLLAELSESNYGQECEVRVYYLGGDNQLEIQVIDGAAATLATKTLVAHLIPAFESVFFTCPTKAVVVGNNNKGDIKIKINNTGASAAAVSDWDEMYLGLNDRRVETSFAMGIHIEGCQVDNGGSATISTDSELCESWVLTVNRPSLGIIDHTYNVAHFAAEPVCTCSPADQTSTVTCLIEASTSTKVTTRTKNVADTLVDRAVSLVCIGRR